MLGNVDLKFYLSIFLRRLPYFIVIVTFFSAVGIAVASILPPTYRSSAALLVEAPQIPGELAQSTVPTNPVEQIQIIQQRLMTRANILSLAEKFQIYADQPGMPADAIVADMRARTSLWPQAPGPRSGGGATIITVSFSSPDPQEAAEVTNELVTLILQENVSLRTGRAEDTLEFFQGDRPGRGHARVLPGRGRAALGRARPHLPAHDGLQGRERHRAARQPGVPPQPAGDPAGAPAAVRARGDGAAGRARAHRADLRAHRPGGGRRRCGHGRGARPSRAARPARPGALDLLGVEPQHPAARDPHRRARGDRRRAARRARPRERRAQRVRGAARRDRRPARVHRRGEGAHRRRPRRARRLDQGDPGQRAHPRRDAARLCQRAGPVQRRGRPARHRLGGRAARGDEQGPALLARR